MKKLFSIIALASTMITTTAIAQDSYNLGNKVSSFNLKNVDGKMVSLDGLKGNAGAIVIFTCNHCPYSVAYEDRIIALHNEFAKQGFPVIAINSNDPKASPEDSYAKMKVRAKDKKFPFVYLYDETQTVAKQFGATRTPHVFLLQKQTDGQYQLVYRGAIDNNHKDAAAADKRYVAAAIVNILSGAQVAESETKAIGCTIKWKSE